jgi:hypothetical protein
VSWQRKEKPKKRGQKTAKPSAMLRTGGFAFFPTNADFREGIIRAVEPGVPNVPIGTMTPSPTRKA